MRIILLDLETTGLNPNSSTIIEIGAVSLDMNTLRDRSWFNRKIKFIVEKAEPKALSLNSYRTYVDRPEDWNSIAISPRDAATEFLDWLRKDQEQLTVDQSTGERSRKAVMAAYNSQFDFNFLKAWFDRLQMPMPFRDKGLCLMERTKAFFLENPHLPKPKSMKLSDVLDCLGLSSDVDFHTASGDVHGTLKLYRRIIGV